MRPTNRYLLFPFFLGMLLAMAGCQKNTAENLFPSDEVGRLTLHFNLTPTGSTRGYADGVTELYYEVKDGALVPCGIPVMTRAIGDGNVADGGGMADLTVFLVGTSDRIVARQSFSALSDATTQTIIFNNVEMGQYTVYAYANTEGNDWFAMPGAGEASFAAYKDALLKPLDGTASPFVGNGRMPLTGKKTVAIKYGDNNETIEMIRPVGKLTVSIINNKNITIEPTNFSLGNIFPKTGYAFPHDAILPQDAVSNPYYELPNLSVAKTILPNVTYNVYETLMYESENDEAIHVSMAYKTESVTIRDFTGALNSIQTGTKIIIKLVGVDLYLSVNPETKELIMVPASEFDEYCVWNLYGSGNQNRPIEHGVFDGYYIASELFKIVTTKKPNDLFLRFEGSVEATEIDDLKYNIDSKTFSINASDPSLFQLFSVGDVEVGTGGIDKDVLEKIENSELTHELTDIWRNQHIKLNILFKD